MTSAHAGFGFLLHCISCWTNNSLKGQLNRSGQWVSMVVWQAKNPPYFTHCIFCTERKYHDTVTSTYFKWKCKSGRLNVFQVSASAKRIWLDIVSSTNEIILLERGAHLYMTSPLLRYCIFQIGMMTQYVYISVVKIGVNQNILFHGWERRSGHQNECWINYVSNL